MVALMIAQLFSLSCASVSNSIPAITTLECDMPKSKRKKPRGPAPTHVKLTGPWNEAVKRALGKKRPKRGWPKHKK